MKIIILAGGGGTRLFPLSRKLFPKQFLNVDSNVSLLGETILRFKAIVQQQDIVIVTNNLYVDLVKKVLNDVDCTEANIVCEPEARNTAPAIALAAQFCQDKLGANSAEVLFVSTSDHIIRPMLSFQKAVLKAGKLAKAGNLVTFGINPTKPETGFGYIETGEDIGAAFITKSFKEKPDIHTAREYLASGRFFWNSGMFAFTIGTYMSELSQYAPDVFNNIKEKYEDTVNNFSNMPDISIDYAVAEKSQVGLTIPLKLYWNDVGSWDAIFDIMDKDDNGNAINAAVVNIDSRDNLFYGNKRIIGAIGIRDLLVIDTDDILMIAHRGDSQKVKKFVQILKENGNLPEK